MDSGKQLYDICALGKILNNELMGDIEVKELNYCYFYHFQCGAIQSYDEWLFSQQKKKNIENGFCIQLKRDYRVFLTNGIKLNCTLLMMGNPDLEVDDPMSYVAEKIGCSCICYLVINKIEEIGGELIEKIKFVALKTIQECIVCHKTPALHCSSCKCVHYCNKDCQIKDWSSHKKVCQKIIKNYIKRN